MPRPVRKRIVGFQPEVTYFKPAGIPLTSLEETKLTIEEFEALRLKDKEGLDQETAAEKMGISQPTFHRLIAGARKKLTEAIVDGKAIRIEGGNFEFKPGIHRRRGRGQNSKN